MLARVSIVNSIWPFSLIKFYECGIQSKGTKKGAHLLGCAPLFWLVKYLFVNQPANALSLVGDPGRFLVPQGANRPFTLRARLSHECCPASFERSIAVSTASLVPVVTGLSCSLLKFPVFIYCSSFKRPMAMRLVRCGYMISKVACCSGVMEDTLIPRDRASSAPMKNPCSG